MSAKRKTTKQKITPCLWFDFNAEEAVDYYRSIFPRSKILKVSHYNDAVPSLKGEVLTILFELEGQRLLALNGGPQYRFTEAISLSVDCEDQAEVDDLWEKLSDGGKKGPCGWLKDKFGLSWQIVPRKLVAMISDPNPEKASRVMTAMMSMHKLDIGQLQQAYNQA
jgi:predicted 3-demethylubiquinone-9 3-methyltransferase (glyoxalase superfamily)